MGRLHGAEIADEHDDERSEQGQRWKGAVEQQIRSPEQREFEAKESGDDHHSETGRAHRPCVAQQPDDREPGRERRSEL